MDPQLISALCERLSENGSGLSAIEEIRVWLGATTLRLHCTPSHPLPERSDSTQWYRPAVWRGRAIAWLEGTGPIDEVGLSSVGPLIAWSLVLQQERLQTEARATELEVRTRRATEISELVVWLLHARDVGEVERLGTLSVATLLGVDAGALLTKTPGGQWLLRVPALELVAEGLDLSGSRHLDLLSRSRVEFEALVMPGSGPLEQTLFEWGFRHAFSVSLDSGIGPQGVLLALSHTPRVMDAEAQVAAAQLSIMIAVALDRLGDQRRLADHGRSLEEALERLRHSQGQLQQAGVLARVGGWDYDVAAGQFKWSNEMRALYESDADFLSTLGPTSQFYSKESFAALKGAMQLCEFEGTPFDLELEVTTASGKKFWARHLGNAEQLAGRTVRIAGAVQDVTNQRLAREQALTLSRVKSQFLANTSHEIRTPLNGLLGMTQLALETQLNGEQREYLEAARTSGENLLVIVNDILDISKIESGRLELERIPFSIHKAIYETVRTHAGRAHGKGLELIVDVQPGMPEQVLGDPVRFGQIVNNLLGNAVKFTERGEVCVTASFTGEQLRLSVRDTGIGVPADRVHSIFDAFTQADGSTNRRFGGTGLGLTITLELVKAMGGRIEVDSVVGEGSTFCAWIGVTVAPSVPRLTKPARGLRVMVVSGNSRGQAVTVRQLEHLGCQVIAVPADRAVRRLKADGKTLDLLVLDQELEGTSGTELCEAMAVHDGLNRLPRLLLTRTTRPSSAQLKAANVQRVLTRPVSTFEFAETVAQLQPVTGFKRQEAPVTPLRTRRSLKVLLAEDNAINARLAVRLLEKLGHQVTHVTNGATAVSAVAQGRWDAVLMDLQMPVLDGLEATREIRVAEQGTGARVAIIALTANAMKGDDLICLEAGMDAYLTKPIDLERLATTLEVLAPATGMTA